MRNTLILAALLAAAPFAASAQDAVSYTYVEGGWTQFRIDDQGVDEKADGGYLRGSVAIAPQLYVFGGYATVSKTWRDDDARLKVSLDQPELGFGYHQAFGDNLDFTADLSYVRINSEVKYSDAGGSERYKDDSDAGRVLLGLRGKPSPRTEAWIKAGYMDGQGLDNGEFVGVLGGQVSFNKTWGLVGEAQVIDNTRQFSFGVRASF